MEQIQSRAFSSKPRGSKEQESKGSGDLDRGLSSALSRRVACMRPPSLTMNPWEIAGSTT
eukprot:9208103-Heterocapsa_arctica.AAC.1